MQCSLIPFWWNVDCFKSSTSVNRFFALVQLVGNNLGNYLCNKIAGFGNELHQQFSRTKLFLK